MFAVWCLVYNLLCCMNLLRTLVNMHVIRFAYTIDLLLRHHFPVSVCVLFLRVIWFGVVAWMISTSRVTAISGVFEMRLCYACNCCSFQSVTTELNCIAVCSPCIWSVELCLQYSHRPISKHIRLVPVAFAVG
ncbi:hypothetical protein VPH35_071564 [Triticum aestivum]